MKTLLLNLKMGVKKKLDKEKEISESNSNANVDCFKTINELQENQNVCSCLKLANKMIEDKKETIITIDFLQDYKNWVFLPQLISVDYLNGDTKQFESFVESSFELNKSIVAPECRPIMLTAGNKIVTNQLKIKLYGIKNLPDWLPGKRRHGWIFLDEIKVY